MESRVDFSAVARVYHLLEAIVFGRALQRRRCAFLPYIAGAHRVLLLGDGDGRFAVEYARLNPQSLLHMVDVSPGMQRIAQRRFSQRGLSSEFVTWAVADARSFAFDESFDLVVTHFFLDCFSDGELERLVPRIAHVLAGKGRWLLSEFRVPPKGFPRVLGKFLIWAMYRFFNWFAHLRPRCLPCYARILRANNLRCVARQTALGGLLVSEVWQALSTSTEEERSLPSASS